MTYLATNLATPSLKQQLSLLFRQFDRNNDGQLSKDELLQGLTLLFQSAALA